MPVAMPPTRRQACLPPKILVGHRPSFCTYLDPPNPPFFCCLFVNPLFYDFSDLWPYHGIIRLTVLIKQHLGPCWVGCRDEGLIDVGHEDMM